MGAPEYIFHSETLVSFGACWKCGVPIYGPKNRHDTALNNTSESFYCINGHSAVFKERESEQLQRQLQSEREAKERMQRALDVARQAEAKSAHAAATARGKLRAQSQRIKNGVCPCCKRSFVQLQRHMKTQHPGFGSGDAHV